jgi:hypothetical protein
MGKRNKFIFLFEFFFPSSLLPNLRMMDRPFLFDFLVASDPLSNDGWKMLYRIKRETCYVYSWKRWFSSSPVVVSFWTENATWFVWTWRPLLAAHCVKAWRCIKACRRKMKIKGKTDYISTNCCCCCCYPFFLLFFFCSAQCICDCFENWPSCKRTAALACGGPGLYLL